MSNPFEPLSEEDQGMAARTGPTVTPEEFKLTRNLVLCLDGTSNQFSAENTNVIKLFSVLDISPGYQKEGQMAYYDSGVGTYLPVGATTTWSSVKQWGAKAWDMAVAWNFDEHVLNAYKWLMDYYQPGDKIFLFGFSRGAYAVRVLAGMIQKVGLLPAGNHCQISLAYDVYKSPSDVGQRGHFGAGVDLPAKYRSIFGISREVEVHFIGVWDTVSSLGGRSAPDLPFADAVSMVTYFRQALALDERRVKFQPEYRCNNPDEPDERILGIERHKEVWFLGVHSSVGGGNDSDDGPSLSHIPFRWMLWEAVQCGLRTAPISILQTYALMAIPTVGPYVHNFLPDHISQAFQGPVLPRVALSRHCAAEIQRVFTEERRDTVVRLAAEYDTVLSAVPANAEVGLPMTPDLWRPKTESLSRPAYLIMELLWLERRWYTENDSGQYVERRINGPHCGDGRYILQDQKIHLSVLKRALIDQAVNRGAVPPPPIGDYAPYPTINAHLAPSPGIPQTWNTLLHISNRPLPSWEVS